MRARGLACCKCDKLHAAIRVEREHKSLGEGREAAEESLAVTPVGEPGSWMLGNAAPVIDKANDDENNDQEDLDKGKPVFAFAWTYVDQSETQTTIRDADEGGLCMMRR